MEVLEPRWKDNKKPFKEGLKWLKARLREIPWEDAPDEGRYIYREKEFATVIQMLKKLKENPNEEYAQQIRRLIAGVLIKQFEPKPVILSTQIEDSCKMCNKVIIMSNHSGHWKPYNLDGTIHREQTE